MRCNWRIMAKNHLDIYTDYLAVTFNHATASGLSSMLDGAISHDGITRFLSDSEFTSKDLWLHVKSTVRHIERDDGVLIFDDTIQEKRWTDENEIMCWHYDHSLGRSVRGINLLNCLYHSHDVSIPVAFEIIHKPILYSDVKTRKIKRRSEVTKNQLMRQMLTTTINNQLKFKYVLMDSWFSSKENMSFIKRENNKDFICAVKSNRLIALSKEDRRNGRFSRIDTLDLQEEIATKAWIKGVDFPVLLVRKTFKNKDGSSGTLYLACSDLNVEGPDILTIYKQRWKVEVFHKSLKQNAALAKSPTRRAKTQSNHIFAAIIAVFKLECLNMKQSLNHFELKGRLYLKTTKAAFAEWQNMVSA